MSTERRLEIIRKALAKLEQGKRTAFRLGWCSDNIWRLWRQNEISAEERDELWNWVQRLIATRPIEALH